MAGLLDTWQAHKNDQTYRETRDGANRGHAYIVLHAHTDTEEHRSACEEPGARLTVGIHNHIWAYTQVVEWHILLADNQTTHSLLTVTTRELVSKLRTTSGAHADLDQESLIVI